MMDRNRRLLWVDDQIEELAVYVKALEEDGFMVSTADSCSKAIALAKTNTYDIILVDILMPPPDGIETLRQLQPIQPGAALGVLSSYLYLDKYREELRALEFPVELIDKDLTNVEANDFKMRFIEPVKTLADKGVTYTIKEQDKVLSRASDVDPFTIPLSEFIAKSLLEKDRLADMAQKLAAHAIKQAFEKGMIWVLFCGSPTKPRASASHPAEILSEEQIMEFARVQKRAPFQFFRGVHVDDIWCPYGEDTSLKDYPTVTIFLGGSSKDIHFDTGAPMTFFSYEELLRLGVIRPTTVFGSGSRGLELYRATYLNIEAMLRCQRSGQTKMIRLIGQAVRNWIGGPFARNCKGTCVHRETQELMLCPRRIGLIGRNLLTDNAIVLILDGKQHVTGLEV
jgi:CheY-like chemotaxis protein